MVKSDVPRKVTKNSCRVRKLSLEMSEKFKTPVKLPSLPKTTATVTVKKENSSPEEQPPPGLATDSICFSLLFVKKIINLPGGILELMIR